MLKNKEHESNKNALPCLLDTLSVFLWRSLAISALFQGVVGSLFSRYIFIFLGNYMYERETVKLRTYHE